MLGQELGITSVQLSENDVASFQPQFLGEGGVQIAYNLRHKEAANHSLVAKVSKVSIADWVYAVLDSNEPLDSIPELLQSVWTRHIHQMTETQRRLQAVFGKDHVVPERYYEMQLPISISKLEQILNADWRKRSLPEGISNIESVWAIVSLQPYCDAIEQEMLSFHFGGYAEQRHPEHIDKLAALTTQLTLPPYSLSEESIETFLELQDGTKALSDLLSRAKVDSQLHFALKEFVRGCIAFAQKSETILALAGKDNVFFHSQSGHWTYTLLDPMTIHDEPLLQLARKYRELPPHQLTEFEKTILLKVNNFVRVINGMASLLGIEERLI